MTDTVQIALIVAVAPTIAAIGALVVTLRAKKEIVPRLDHITTLTNSTLTAAKQQIEELKDEVAGLRDELNKRP